MRAMQMGGEADLLPSLVLLSNVPFRLLCNSDSFPCIPSEEQIVAADYVGIVSGRDHNKFEEAELTPVNWVPLRWAGVFNR